MTFAQCAKNIRGHMPSDTYLNILREGAEYWNHWRQENPTAKPDLRGANIGRTNPGGTELLCALASEQDVYAPAPDLSGADFRGVDLSGADLFGVRLQNALFANSRLVCAQFGTAELTRADFTATDLRGVRFAASRLNRAILQKADLRGADLSHANAAGTDFSGADLRRCTFCETILARANLSDAIVGGTTFAGVNLTKVVGLSRVRHYGPSFMGAEVMYMAKSAPPPEFLRGVGVPNGLIDYAKSLFQDAIQYYSCFISYSAADHSFADRLHTDLQARGVRCWYAPHDLRIGDRFRVVIDESIRIHDKLLLVLSENSIGSSWVEKEVETAFEKERRRKVAALFPVMLDRSVMTTGEAWAADIRRTRHIGDFTAWKEYDRYQVALAQLIRDLQPPA